MDPDESVIAHISDEHDTRSAVNSMILDYYKKFGRKRDLEQYFSLTTAQSEIRDPRSLFWRKIKMQNDSSDSGEKPSESSTELCRISIKCSIPDELRPKDDCLKSKNESDSPPIIEEMSNVSNDESVKSDDNRSQKSVDVTLDTSINKPLSPTSSVTSQRRLEWDSLADVGYANESDRKNSASSLSTLEKLALLQQYSNNDNKEIGPPTAHSTLLDPQNDPSKKCKSSKKHLVKKTKEINKSDTDVFDVNIPQPENAAIHSFSVNLTKHISFNVGKDGDIIENTQKETTCRSPEKTCVETEIKPVVGQDKEIQTSLLRSNTCVGATHCRPKFKNCSKSSARVPVLISLNTLRRNIRRRRSRNAKKKLNNKHLDGSKKKTSLQEKSGAQVSEAESFEYMPGHIYNQNQISKGQQKARRAADNKSSLESSRTTTESSTTNSFTKDLEKSIKMLNAVLQRHHDNSDIKKQLVKEVVQKLLKSKYRDDNTIDFLSGLSFNSKYLDVGKSSNNYTTTSTSDANTSADKAKKPKKSILRMDKFNANAIASTSQSAPNLPSVSKSEKPLIPGMTTKSIVSSHTDSDLSSKEKYSSETAVTKTSSELLYQKYLEAIRKEEAYKKHLRDKENFLRCKLVGSDGAIRPNSNIKTNKLKELMTDLTRNNYDDGSGDASMLEGGSIISYKHNDRNSVLKKLNSHSVFTLSSGNSEKKYGDDSDRENRKKDLRKRLEEEINADTSTKRDFKNEHYCCCPHHSVRQGVTDSSVQVNIEFSPFSKNEKKVKSLQGDSSDSNMVTDLRKEHKSQKFTDEIQYVCLCTGKEISAPEVPENYLIYKCSRMPNRPHHVSANITKHSDILPEFGRDFNHEQDIFSGIQKMHENSKPSTSSKNVAGIISNRNYSDKDDCTSARGRVFKKMSQSSQTDIAINILGRKHRNKSTNSSESKRSSIVSPRSDFRPAEPECFQINQREKRIVHEITRCIQTEISINPKISEPTLSDINIINEAECVKIVSENYRQISVQTLNDNCNHNNYLQDNKDSETQIYEADDFSCSVTPQGVQSQESIPCSLSPVVVNNEISNLPLQPRTKKMDSLPFDCIGKNTEYSIPLKGTNMTLMVSIGEKTLPNPEANIGNELKTQGVGTDLIECKENATSLFNECSKGVQSQNVNVFETLFTDYIKPSTQKNSSKNILDRKTEQDFTLNKIKRQSCLESTLGSDSSPRLNTYPTKTKKSILRTNTDTELKKYCETKTVQDTDNQVELFSKPPEESQEIADQQKKFTSGKCNIDSSKSINHGESKQLNEFKQELTALKDPQPSKCSEKEYNNTDESDPILNIIKDITKRYKKKDIEKGKRKKCFKEIMSVLNYLLEAEDDTSTRDSDKSPDCPQLLFNSDTQDQAGYIQQHDIESIPCIRDIASSSIIENGSKKRSTFRRESTITPASIPNQSQSSSFNKNSKKNNAKDCAATDARTDKTNSLEDEKVTNKIHPGDVDIRPSSFPKQLVDKAIQLTLNNSHSKKSSTDSSDLPISSDLQNSSDTVTCKILNKIKKECEKYHQRKCKSCHQDKKCNASSSSSMTCDKCQIVHHCHCKPTHRCKTHKTAKSAYEKLKKKCIAYNLILQTSDSVVNEEIIYDKNKRQLQNIIVKVPPKRDNVIFKEVNPPCHSRENPYPQQYRGNRSRSLPNENEISSTDDYKRAQNLTVRDYLEKNRPDFVEKTSNRQNCLKLISESRNNEDSSPPSPLKMVVVHTPKCFCLRRCEVYCPGMPIDCCQFVNPCMDTARNEVTRIASPTYSELPVGNEPSLSIVSRANERNAHRRLLSLQLERESSLNRISASDIRRLAQEFGVEIRHRRVAPKFISERDMKKHSEKIYKSLPEVIQKKEDLKKERIKKTNLLMANMFKKNLQRKTLRGSVNISNYSAVIKI